MSVTLHEYQKKAVESRKTGLLHFTLGALEENSDECGLAILKAITGSGKTVIAAHYINVIPLLLIQFDSDPANAGLLETRDRLKEMGEAEPAIWVVANAKDADGSRLRSDDELPSPKITENANRLFIRFYK